MHKIVTDMEDNFDDYSVQIDEECLSQDFDDIDLYAERLEEEEDTSDILFE